MSAAVLCGQLACQRDSLLRTLRTTVLSCVAKKKHFQLELADSVLFPEGGGQPCDSGTVAPADGAGAPSNVLSVANVGGRCVHTVDRALPEGVEVEVTVDWPRRQEHTQQHSAPRTARKLRSLLPPRVAATCDWHPRGSSL